MAFGESWGIVRAFHEQLKALVDSPSSLPSGKHGEPIFPAVKPEIAESTWYVFEVSCAAAVLRRGSPPSGGTVSNSLSSHSGFLHRFQTRLSSTSRPTGHIPQDSYCRGLFLGLRRGGLRLLYKARAKASQRGVDVANEMADNTLDLMVARELRGEDFMPENEMKDELLQCTFWAISF